MLLSIFISTPFVRSIPLSAPFLYFMLLPADRREPVSCSLLHHLQSFILVETLKPSVHGQCFSASSLYAVPLLASIFLCTESDLLLMDPNSAAILFLLLQMKMHLLVFDFLDFYLRGVQRVSLIVLSIASPNQCAHTWKVNLRKQYYKIIHK